MAPEGRTHLRSETSFFVCLCLRLQATRVTLSGYSGTSPVNMGIYADTGRLIHGNPLFQHEDSATHFLFVSSGSGMWVLTNAESNFEGNLGYVRYASREGYPSAPAQSWTGEAWEPDAALKVSVQACVPLPPDDKYHCFMTHDWGHDMLGRPNHDRVKRVNAAFKAAGLSARAHHTNHRHRAL